MIKYENVRSTVKPESIKTDAYNVFVCSSIKEIHENTGEQDEFNGYEYDMAQYSKDEYINALSNDLNDTQAALIELASIIGGDTNG